MASVELKQGDMFHSGPADLIVLPCSTSGTITRFVQEKLWAYSLPHPPERMLLGQVAIEAFHGGEEIASYIAYAASVHGVRSSESAIREIGVALGRASTNNPAIRRVFAPLLGAGTGNLLPDAVVRELSAGFMSTAQRDASLVIHSRPKAGLSALESSPSSGRGGSRTRYPEVRFVAGEEPPLRVFISYSRGDEQHEAWVRALATFLRESGLEARLDQWHLRPGMEILHFMNSEIQLADRVVIVSDRRYAEKANGRVGGIGWEAGLVQGDLYRLGPESTKYVVVAKDTDLDSCMPTFLRDRLAIHWRDDSDAARYRSILMDALLNVTNEPPITRVPQ